MHETIAILQGWPQPTTAHWYPWLKRELEQKRYNVLLPELPTMLTNKPIMSDQLIFLENLLNFDPNVSIIGHSLGSVVAMRYAEKHPLNKLIVIGGFDYDDLTEALLNYWPNKINHARVINNTHKRFIIHSDNDPYFTKFNAEAMAKRLQAAFICIDGAGHFMEEDGWKTLPPVAALF